jgi:copper transport protein
MRRSPAVAAVVAGAALLLPAAASAHATLVEAEPATQAELREAPSLLRLRFTEPVTVAQGGVQVLGRNGTEHAGAASVSADGLVVTTPLSGLERGSSYTVRWRVTSTDGHSPSGVYNFGVRVEPPPPTDSVGASATTLKDDLARWALFAALALVVGPLVVRLAILRGDAPPAVERRFHLVTIIAAFAVIDVGIVAFLVRASNALQLPLGDLLYGDLQPFAEQTRFGLAFLVMTVGFAVVAALLALAWALDRRELRVPALALSLLLVSGLSLSGHQATEPNATLASELADWLHLVAACVWVGGLVTLAFVVWPAAAPALRRRAFLGFSRLAIVLVAVLVLAGGYLAVVRLPEISDLWETGYGRLLLVKLGIVAFALAWGGIHHLFVRPRIAAGRDPHVRPSLVGETALALVVLLAAAALTNASPPPPVADQPSAARSSR